MSNFYSERKILKQHLEDRKAEIKLHRQTLESFENMKTRLTENTSPEILQLIEETILDRISQVKTLEHEIREIERTLKEKYSLRPAS